MQFRLFPFLYIPQTGSAEFLLGGISVGGYGMNRKYVPKGRCVQVYESEECFGRNRVGNCSALDRPDYPCGACPFYKPERVFRQECMETYSRLTALGRTDLIMKYEIRDYGLSGSWTGKGRLRR